MYIYTYKNIHIVLYVYIYTHTHTHIYIWISLLAQLVKNLPTMQEIRVQSLGREDPLERKIATHSSILAWRIHGKGAWQATIHRVTRVRHDLVTKPPYI